MMWRRESVNILACILMVCPVAVYAAEAGRAKGVDLQFSLQDEPVTVSVSGKVTDKRTGEPSPMRSCAVTSSSGSTRVRSCTRRHRTWRRGRMAKAYTGWSSSLL